MRRIMLLDPLAAEINHLRKRVGLQRTASRLADVLKDIAEELSVDLCPYCQTPLQPTVTVMCLVCGKRLLRRKHREYVEFGQEESRDETT